jgi:cytochrome c-type biogenesis protein CcmH/NrfF
MDSFPLIWLLPIATFLIVLAVAWRSKRKTDAMTHERREDKSSLAKDGPGPNPIRERK